MKEPQPRVQWQSVRWPDGSTFEGLVKDDKCHVRGVFKYSNGDRYEGEFVNNNMGGFGVYVWGSEGSVYRGQWSNSMMQGCGVKITKQPAGGYLAEEGLFVNDEWVGDVMGCSIEQARAAAAEADTAAQMARVFEQLGDAGAADDPVTARAQEAAATAAAVAQHAKSRRHHRQQRVAADAQAALDGAAGTAPAVQAAVPAAGPKVQTLGLAQLAQQGMQHAALQASLNAQRAAHWAQQAARGASERAKQTTQSAQAAAHRAAAQAVAAAQAAQQSLQRTIEATQQKLKQQGPPARA